MVAGVVETQICEVLHILLDDLRDVLNPLGGGLGRVGERFPPSVHLRQGALERRGCARRLPSARLVPLRRKFLYFGRTVGGHVGAEGGCGEQGGVQAHLLHQGRQRGRLRGRVRGGADQPAVGRGGGQAAGHVEGNVRTLQELKYTGRVKRNIQTLTRG